MKVDVLAVMDRAADQLGQAGHNETANALLAARDEVAEMIAADKEYDTAQRSGGAYEKADAANRRRVALATLSREGR